MVAKRAHFVRMSGSITDLKILILKQYRAVAIHPSKSSNNIAVSRAAVRRSIV